ncbi:MAG: integrase, partial [Lautropia sp.]|nr:integrase [Lautropia sp.]
MVIEMNEGKHVTLAQVREFLAGTADVGMKALGEDAERYRWIAAVLSRLGYRRLKRADRGLVLRYLGAGVGLLAPA